MILRRFKRHVFGLSVVVLFVLNCSMNDGSACDDSDQFFENARKHMVERQIKGRGISDKKIVDAFLTVPRHLFVPEIYKNEAYNDHPLPIGAGQTISQPYIVAYMTEVLNVTMSDRILEIGTGSGYQAAILAELCDQVYSIEIVESLAQKAGKLFQQLGYANIHTKTGDGYLGWPEHAPFDAIIVTCASKHVPQPLIDQLKEGGRMVIPVGNRFWQELVYLEKVAGELKEVSVLPVLFVPMVDSTGKGY